jgi:bifunctional DNA-binding transcriptional regulator/antitoxin component of YhaV-PrlF toxin-antitoxin module
METILDKEGRIAIPLEVRSDMGLVPGAVLRIEERGEGIFLTPIDRSSRLVQRDGVLVVLGELDKAAGLPTAALESDREARMRKLMGLA